MAPSSWSVSVAILVVVLAILARAALRRRRPAHLAPPGRPMGALEQTFDLMHRIGGFVIVIVAKVEGDVELGAVRRALDVLQAKHPLFRVHVTGPDGLFHGEGTQPIPLVSIARKSGEQWLEVVRDELERPIPYGTHPLLKATWIYETGVSAELLLTMNHAIVDGAGAAIIFRDFLAACAEGAGAGPATVVDAASGLPPLDAGIARYTGLRPPREPRPALLLPAKPSRVAERRAMVAAERIPPAAMSILLQRCREKNTTFHGLLCASALFALCVEFGADRELSLSSNVSIRQDLEPPVSPESVGCFIGAVTTHHGVAADAELWATARSVREAIARYTMERTHIRWLARGLNWLEQLGLRHLLARVNDGRINALNVSNSGKFEIPPAPGGPELREIYFFSAQHVIGSTLQISVVSLAETPFVTFSWARPVLSDDEARRIMATVQRVFDLVAANEEVTVASLSPRSPPSPRRKTG